MNLTAYDCYQDARSNFEFVLRKCIRMHETGMEALRFLCLRTVEIERNGMLSRELHGDDQNIRIVKTRFRVLYASTCKQYGYSNYAYTSACDVSVLTFRRTSGKTPTDWNALPSASLLTALNFSIGSSSPTELTRAWEWIG